jgi:ABC-type multidrug transport system fused ATPase/permease subunit
LTNLFGQVGYASLIILFACLLIMALVILTFAQFLCLAPVVTKDEDDKCVKNSGRILNVVFLLTIVVCCSIGIFYFSIYYSSVWNQVDNIKDVMSEKRNYVQSINTTYKGIDKSVTTLTPPKIVESIRLGTNRFDNILSSVESNKMRALEQWGPVTMYVIIMMVSIAGLLSLFYSKKIFFIFIAVLVGIMFIFILVTAVTGGVVSLFLSDFCVDGVDNHTVIIINAYNSDGCTQQAFYYYLFCHHMNSTCNVLPSFLNSTNNEINRIQNDIKNDPRNPDVTKWRNTVSQLKGTIDPIEQLMLCEQNVYIRATAGLCGEATPALIMSTNILTMLVGLIFLFLMAAVRFNPVSRMPLSDDVDIETEKKERRRGLRTKAKKETKGGCYCTGNCVRSFVIFIACWFVFVLVFIILMSVGSDKVVVHRY